MCKSLRAAVDKLGIHIDFVKFQVDGIVKLNLNGQKIKYTENGETGTAVTFIGQEKIFPAENFMEIAFNDLELLLKNPISTLDLSNFPLCPKF